MVSYDLPWNPNRIEQRFDYIHRIGQTEVCRLWNLVATNTREGAVFETLLAKIEEQRKALGRRSLRRVGRSLRRTPLRELLMDAIRYGERPEVRARMNEVIDRQVETVSRSWWSSERWRPMCCLMPNCADCAARWTRRARRLQPHYIELAFRGAFTRLGGRMTRRERGRFEIANVPASIRAATRLPVAGRYEQ